jgi:hypothetical protein
MPVPMVTVALSGDETRSDAIAVELITFHY